MMNKINSVIRFLQAARNLAKQGMTKEQILDFARREFGEISKLLRKQIDDIYSRYKKPKTEKKGEVVPIKKDEGIKSTKEYKDMVEELRNSEIGNKYTAEELEQAALEILETKNKLKATLESEQVLKKKPFSESTGFPKNPYRPGGALDPVIGITRTLARRILDKKGIKIDRREDPIDVFENTIGFDALTDVKNLAEEVVEAGNTGRRLKSMDELLELEGLFDVKIPKNPVKGIPDDEFIKMVEGVESKGKKIISKEFQLDVEKFAKEFPVSKEEALRISKLPSQEQQKILQKYIDEDFKQQIQLSDFDVTGRKPNADGGLIDILKI